MAKNLLTVTVKACVDDVKGLIEQLKSLQTYKLFEGDDMTLVDINDVIEIFTNHIMAERTTGDDTVHWIPCNERMPEKSGNYIVSGKWDSGKISVGECEYSVDDGYFQTSWNFDVLAWMPMPEPYKE